LTSDGAATTSRLGFGDASNCVSWVALKPLVVLSSYPVGFSGSYAVLDDKGAAFGGYCGSDILASTKPGNEFESMLGFSSGKD
jgi:hypothetical protein